MRYDMRNEGRVVNEQKNISFNELLNQYIKMNYYWFNRQEILQKAKEKYSKKKLLSIINKTKKL